MKKVTAKAGAGQTKAEADKAPPVVMTDAQEQAAVKRAASDADALAEFFISDGERLSVDSYEGDASQRRVNARDMVELLAFWVADEEYAVAIVEIQEIIKLPNITVVPRAPEAVLGIISLRGTIVPVVDLRRILRLEERPVSRQSRILVLQAAGDPIGVLVDRVTSVVRLETSAIEATPRTMQRHDTELLRGVGRIADRLIIILDVAAVLNVMESAA